MNEFKQKERYSIEYLIKMTCYGNSSSKARLKTLGRLPAFKDRFLRVGCGPV